MGRYWLGIDIGGTFTGCDSAPVQSQEFTRLWAELAVASGLPERAGGRA